MLRFHKYQQIEVPRGNKRCLFCETMRNTQIQRVGIMKTL